ncbi:MAG: DUF2852 domain-containing protein [Arenicellales bacterium WSBS_2016_MAG_OTU3]
MSSANAATNGQNSNRSHGHCCGGLGKRGNWSGTNIACMVLGFILFWPIGLFVLYWIVTGRNVKELPQAIRHQWSKVTRRSSDNGDFHANGRSANVVFDEFQQTQFDRIRELKEEIKERSRRFSEYRSNAKRHSDEEEFERFMSGVPRADD